ncbi:unnamed protein product [Blepharisma stoltei]|uniref:PCI domain-containing protein n=1 Tax=Blepharisma stoltei TaxID=1481888 RepID=A0AAU9JWR8_9CILI|nr:unnamed protein product [Blepharisma stoltei]
MSSGSEFEEYEYDSDKEGWSDEEDVDEELVTIENTFYEADDIKKTNPEDALTGFLKVLELEGNRPESEQQWRFKALKNVVVLECTLGFYEPMCSHLAELIGLIDTVASNDATDAINSIIDVSSKITDPTYSMRVLSMILEKLKESGKSRLVFNTQTKLAKLYLERNDVENAESTISELVSSCHLPNGQVDNSKSQSLLEAYALEIQLCTVTKNSKRMKEIFKKTESLNADVTDPRIIGVIRESGSRMYMSEKSWDKALTELFEAFKCYQEVGNPRAKTILKYVTLASIMANSNINPFHSLEAKVYKDDPEIIAMMRLRSAYETNDMVEVQRILFDKSIKLLDDSYISQYMDDFLRGVRLSVLQAKIKPYKAVRVGFLAQELQISPDSVFSLLIELIMDGKIDAKIDQVDGIVELTSAISDATTRREEAFKKWTRNLRSINSTLIEKVRG